MRKFIALTLLAALCACGKASEDAGPGPAAADEAHALDDAAQMLGTPRPSDDATALPDEAGKPPAGARG